MCGPVVNAHCSGLLSVLPGSARSMLLVPKACGRRPVVNARCSGSLSVSPVGVSAAFDDLSSPSFFEI